VRAYVLSLGRNEKICHTTALNQMVFR
jgi:hypothetical protein